jgi:hypothetical protein
MLSCPVSNPAPAAFGSFLPSLPNGSTNVISNAVYGTPFQCDAPQKNEPNETNQILFGTNPKKPTKSSFLLSLGKARKGEESAKETRAL